MNILRCLHASSLLALTLGFSGFSRVPGATFSVPNGDVSALKRAINAANSNRQADTISLAANGTYTLAQSDNVLNGPNGLPVVGPDGGNALVLQGNGATITRSRAIGTPSFRLLFVNYAAKLSVSGLSLSNGIAPGTETGGGLANAGALTLERCTLRGNMAGAGGGLVHYGSVLNIRNCNISGNRASFGGGLTNYSTLNLQDSTIGGNLALLSAGGIDNAFRARLNAQNSTFFNNRANNGGAIQNFGSTVVLFQCTLSGNVVSERGAGVFNLGGSSNNLPINSVLSLRACTITQNRAAQGGGLNNFRGVARATLSLLSCIVSGNFAGAAPDLANNDTVQNGGFNLIGGNAGLAPLANNGGPTLTHALLPGSRAINAGDLAPGTAFDQRGAPFLRVRGARADIGAFETQQAPSTSPTPTPAPTLAPTPAPTSAPTPAPTSAPMLG